MAAGSLAGSGLGAAILAAMSILAVDSLPPSPLAALRELVSSEAHLDRIRRDQIAAALSEGASWDDVGDALGVSAREASEYYCADVWRRLEANAARNADISDEEAMGIAVTEVRAVRRGRHLT